MRRGPSPASIARILAVLVGALLACVAWLAAPRVARAEPPAEALYGEAEREELAGRFAHALELYDEARALDPGASFAPRAEARAAELRAHAEGAFAPYARLEKVRRDPALASDARAIDDLVRASDDFPPGPVRVEAWALAAEAYTRRLGRPDAAEGLHLRILRDAGADPALARRAAREAVTLLVARGDYAAAADALRLAGDRADPKLASDLARAVRRRYLHFACLALLAECALLALRAWVSAARSGESTRVASALRRIAPVALAYAAYVGVVGGLLASGYEAGTARPFLLFGAALAPILLVARAWAAAGSRSREGRAGRALVCASSALAAAFLVLESVDVSYLEGIGL